MSRHIKSTRDTRMLGQTCPKQLCQGILKAFCQIAYSDSAWSSSSDLY